MNMRYTERWREIQWENERYTVRRRKAMWDKHERYREMKMRDTERWTWEIQRDEERYSEMNIWDTVRWPWEIQRDEERCREMKRDTERWTYEIQWDEHERYREMKRDTMRKGRHTVKKKSNRVRYREIHWGKEEKYIEEKNRNTVIFICLRHLIISIRGHKFDLRITISFYMSAACLELPSNMSKMWMLSCLLFVMWRKFKSSLSVSYNENSLCGEQVVLIQRLTALASLAVQYNYPSIYLSPLHPLSSGSIYKSPLCL